MGPPPCAPQPPYSITTNAPSPAPQDDPGLLREVLLYHLVDAPAPSAGIMADVLLPSRQGAMLRPNHYPRGDMGVKRPPPPIVIWVNIISLQQ